MREKEKISSTPDSKLSKGYKGMLRYSWFFKKQLLRMRVNPIGKDVIALDSVKSIIHRNVT